MNRGQGWNKAGYSAPDLMGLDPCEGKLDE